MTLRDVASTAAAVDICSPIIDLRQYTLYPGTRDRFIELFDREFVETQEAAGMRIIGQFRELGDPNRFVWMRGFRNMSARGQALTSFYTRGEAWRRFGEMARADMIDSTDAMLLHPIYPEAAFALPDAADRPALDAPLSPGLIVATIHSLPKPVDESFLAFFRGTVLPRLASAQGRLLGAFATEYSSNNFPRLPLREDENVVISFLGYDSLAAYHQHMTALGRDAEWRSEVYPALLKRLHGRPHTLRLAPTSRSQLRP